MIKNACVIFLSIFLASCGGGGSSEMPHRSIADTRFNGEFEYIFDYVASNRINETHLKDVLIFNGSTIASNTRYKKNYNSSSGWTYTGSYIGDSLRRNIEFEVDGNSYRYRIVGADNTLSLWGADSNQWSNWNEYSFSNDGNVLSLSGDYARNAFGYSSLVLTKKGTYTPVYGTNQTEVNNLTSVMLASRSDGSKEYEISWNFSGIPQVKGVSYDFDGSNNTYTSISPLPTSTSITINPGESRTFNIKTVDLEGDFSIGLQLTITN